MKKKIPLIILLVVMCLSLGICLLPSNNIKTKFSLVNENMLSFTVDGVESKTMPTKASGYIASKITCTNGSIIVFDNDNWTIEVEKLEADDACYIDFVTNGETKEYDYTGNIEVFTAPTTSEYILEVWGSEGGSYNTTYIGGYGGYSTGIVSLTKGEKLYIVVGGKGTNNSTLETIPGGYNGGGTGSGSANLVYSSSGGGATHIGKASGLLNTLSNNISDIIIVAGGGGGTSFQTGPYSGNGGSGGGYTGNNGTNTQSNYVYGSGGSQTAGGSSGGGSKVNNEDRGLKGSFGQGGNGQHYSGGGGGGFYGGGASNQAGAGGGSGYIGNSLLSNKVMYCYKCTASSSENTKTISTDNVSSTPISNYAKKGNGYVKIKQVVNDSNYYTVKINTNDSSKIDSISKTTTNNGKVTFYVSGEIESVTGCDNTVNDNKIIVNNVTSTTTCNVTLGESNPFDKDTLAYQIYLDKSTRLIRTNFGTVLTVDNTNTLYTSTENDTPVYYFAGNALDNWVKFAGFYWRIIRTNNDKSIRLLYHGTSTTATNAYINSSTAFNSSYNNSMYSGYMYGTSGTLANNRTNENSSTIKEVIDTWYQNNLKTNYEKYLSKNAIYCSDREIGKGNYCPNCSTTFYYAAYNRMSGTNIPTYDCNNNSDKFTVSASTGNGKLSYPIALMTADEIKFAGGLVLNDATSWYYYNSANGSSAGSTFWWLLSPHYWTGSYASVFRMGGSSVPGYLNGNGVYSAEAVRPAVSLKSCVKTSGGNGSASDPYTIKETTSGC
mgnify:FL=1